MGSVDCRVSDFAMSMAVGGSSGSERLFEFGWVGNSKCQLLIDFFCSMDTD